jgi:hypothetical protein
VGSDVDVVSKHITMADGPQNLIDDIAVVSRNYINFAKAYKGTL